MGRTRRQAHAPTTEQWRTYQEHVKEIDEIAAQIAFKRNLNHRTRDTFLEGVHAKIQDEIHMFNPDRPFRPWCWDVLNNHLIDYFRKIKKKPEPLLLGDQLLADSAGEERKAQDRQLPSVDFAEAFEKFVPGLNRVILGIDWRYLRTLEIARALAWLQQATLPENFPWDRLELIEEQYTRRRDLLSELNAARPNIRPLTQNALRVRICNALESLKDGIIRSHYRYRNAGE